MSLSLKDACKVSLLYGAAVMCTAFWVRCGWEFGDGCGYYLNDLYQAGIKKVIEVVSTKKEEE